MIRTLIGDCRDILPTLPALSVHCVVSSPPYFGLRDYGTALWEGGEEGCEHVAVEARRTAWANAVKGPNGAGKNGFSYANMTKEVGGKCGKCGARRVDRQIGLEETPAAYVETLVAVFREVRRVLRDDGTVWLNLGDSYAGSWGNQGRKDTRGEQRPINGPMMQVVDDGRYADKGSNTGKIPAGSGLKPKDLMMIPARVALALQADGWFLRSDVIWAKPNPMPESVTDRPTSAHEHVFLLTKRPTYFYDADAVREPLSAIALAQIEGARAGLRGIERCKSAPDRGAGDLAGGVGASGSRGAAMNPAGRNLRNVWTIASQPFAEAHFAAFPPALVEPCIKAGCPVGGVVLDPFGGAGTVGLVADRLGRDAILIELNPDYDAMARARIVGDAPLLVALAASADDS
jgi:DNA modification methylase